MKLLSPTFTFRQQNDVHVKNASIEFACCLIFNDVLATFQIGISSYTKSHCTNSEYFAFIMLLNPFNWISFDLDSLHSSNKLWWILQTNRCRTNTNLIFPSKCIIYECFPLRKYSISTERCSNIGLSICKIFLLQLFMLNIKWNIESFDVELDHWYFCFWGWLSLLDFYGIVKL